VVGRRVNVIVFVGAGSDLPDSLWQELRASQIPIVANAIVDSLVSNRLVSSYNRPGGTLAIGRKRARTRERLHLCCRLSSDRLPSDRRYRCSATWFDPRWSAEPGKLGEVACALGSPGGNERRLR
jgi:hypothetical protein